MLSRTRWITFHWRGTTSSVSVMSSPSFASRVPPQHQQAVGPATSARSRGRCSANGLRDGRRRAKAATFVALPAARAASDAACSAAVRPPSPTPPAPRAPARAGRAAARCAPSAGRTSRAAASRSAASGGRSAPHPRRPWHAARLPRPPRALGEAPVDALHQTAPLRRADRHRIALRARPYEAAAFQPLGRSRPAMEQV